MAPICNRRLLFVEVFFPKVVGEWNFTAGTVLRVVVGQSGNSLQAPLSNGPRFVTVLLAVLWSLLVLNFCLSLFVFGVNIGTYPPPPLLLLVLLLLVLLLLLLLSLSLSIYFFVCCFSGGGGGGGSFVWINGSTAEPLIAAGGGGGSSFVL